MNWDQLEGGWKQRRGKAVRHWGTLMNDELAKMAGKYEELVGKLQEKYGIAREKTSRQQQEFAKIIAQLRKSNARLMSLRTRTKKTKPTGRRKPAVARGAAPRRSKTRRASSGRS